MRFTPYRATARRHTHEQRVNNGHALIEAIVDRNVPECSRLIKAGAYLESRCGEGWTPLIYASRCGLLEVVIALLDKGASINAVDHLCDTALYWAILSAQPEVALLLLKRGATVRGPTHAPISLFIFTLVNPEMSLVKEALITQGLSED